MVVLQSGRVVVVVVVVVVMIVEVIVEELGRSTRGTE